MSELHLGSPQSDYSDEYAIVTERRGFQSERRNAARRAAGSSAQTERDQLESDIAAIERATAVLCMAEPALQSWTSEPALIGKPRPTWLLLGMLWFSTALITVGAFAAIAAIIGRS
jgi:hypothetical protein